MAELTLTLALKADYNEPESLPRRHVLENRQQLDQFLASIERKAFRMAQIATRNTDDALELVQEAMMKLVEKYANRSESEWTPLFYRILSSKINDFYRRQSVRSRWMSWLPGQKDEDCYYDPIENTSDETLKPEETMQQIQATDQLIEHLQQLSARQQQAFLLRAWEGLSVEETAFAMGCSEGSVKTHYSRAIHALRAELQEHQS